MSARPSPARATRRRRPEVLAPPERIRQRLGERLRSRGFWGVQASVGAITVFHYLAEIPDPQDPWDHLHHLAPALYVFPIIYASLRSGREGGLLTGLWCAVLTIPNIALWHRDAFEWLIEMGQISIAVTVALVLSSSVEQEGRQRRRAEQLLTRVSLVNREILRAQEEERLRIARELHDDTVQNLALLGQRLGDLMDTDGLSEPTIDRLREFREVTGRITAGVRRISRALRPPPLEDLGLVPALESHIRDLGDRSAAQPLNARLEVVGVPRRFDPETEVALFRIVQEALSNVVKHAGATEAVVTVKLADDLVRIEVRDDGRGFDASTSSEHLLTSGRLGLAGMRERAQLMEAGFELASQPGIGTSISVELHV